MKLARQWLRNVRIGKWVPETAKLTRKEWLEWTRASWTQCNICGSNIKEASETTVLTLNDFPSEKPFPEKTDRQSVCLSDALFYRNFLGLPVE